jgi:hypothetical protein
MLQQEEGFVCIIPSNIQDNYGNVAYYIADDDFLNKIILSNGFLFLSG